MTEPPERKSTAALLGEVMDQTVRLVRGEIDLARAEIKSGLRAGMVGIVLIFAAAVMAGAAIDLLAGAAVAALVEGGIGLPGAALLVAGALLVVAAILTWVGIARWRPLTDMPERVARRLARDTETVTKGTEK